MATWLKVGSRVINLDAIAYLEQGSTTLNVHFVGTDKPLALNMGTDRALLANLFEGASVPMPDKPAAMGKAKVV